MGCCGVYPGQRAAMLKGFLYLIVIALSLLVAAAGGDEIIVETSHAIIESHEGKRLRVVFAAEDRPTLIFKPEAGAWDWSQTSQLVIPVENPGDEALTMSLSVEDHTSRSLTGKVAIAPQSAGSLAISVGAPPPRSMGMIAGPSPAAAGLDRGVWPVTATEGALPLRPPVRARTREGTARRASGPARAMVGGAARAIDPVLLLDGPASAFARLEAIHCRSFDRRRRAPLAGQFQRRMKSAHDHIVPPPR